MRGFALLLFSAVLLVERRNDGVSPMVARAQSAGSGDLTEADESCLDYDIVKGDTLEDTCQQHCIGDNFEIFDWAAPRTSNPLIVDRNTWCRCLDPPSGNTTFECSDIEEAVWDRSTPLQLCEEYNITSIATCEDFCQENIDPTAFQVKGSGDNLQCYCASNPQIHICGTSGAATVGWGVMAMTSSLVSIVVLRSSY